MPQGTHGTEKEEQPARRKGKKATEAEELSEHDLRPELTIRQGDLLFELSEDLTQIARICFPVFRNPPTKGLYLQLFHTLTGAPAMMIINGRTFMGNTPTIVAGPNTKMRFGVVGMGNDFHTFHIHGHRWIIPGPDGNTPTAIQNSPMIKAVSQFEDTKIFGPANSFVFTIDEGNGFMRASPAVGEWHMHCHVLGHMDMGMMGSLLIINGGEPAGFLSPLPVGVPCEMPDMGGGGMPPNGGPTTHQVTIKNATNNGFDPKNLPIKVGDSVVWKNNDNQTHTATKTSGAGSPFDTGNISAGASSAPVTFSTAGTRSYRCDIHNNMTGTIDVQM